MIFECCPNLKIYNQGTWYDHDDLARSVAYWCDYLTKIYDQSSSAPLGLLQGSITFSGVCFYLSLYKLKIPFLYLDAHHDYTVNNVKEIFNIQDIVLLGTADPMFRVLPNTISTETFSHAFSMAKFPELADLKFEFAVDHYIYAHTSGSTGTKKLIKISADQEARSIATAITEYFDSDDVCMFSHEMRHKGVHTTAILPALFAVDTIYFVLTQEWPLFITQVNHCQWFPTMKEYYKLTPNISKLTTGGSVISNELLDYIFSQSHDCTVYNIYGLTEMLPPVAINKVTDQSRSNRFRWVRDDLIPAVDQQFTITDTKLNQKISTGDMVDFVSNQEFCFVGRERKTIRVNGDQTNQTTLVATMSNYFDPASFSININNGHLFVQTTGNVVHFEQWCKENSIEKFSVDHVDCVTTSGGIKTTISN